MRFQKTQQKGFTIVELLIVIIVIAILATITIAVFTGVQRQARDSLRDANVGSLLKKVELAKVESGSYSELFSTFSYQDNQQCGQWAVGQLFRLVEIGVPPELLKNPSLPEGVAGSIVILDGNNREIGQLSPDEYPTCRYAAQSPSAPEGQWESYNEFMDDAEASVMEYMMSNPIDPETATPEQMQEFLAGFITAHPRFTCGFDENGVPFDRNIVIAQCNIPDSGEEVPEVESGTLKTRPQDHYYARPTYGPWNCHGANPVTGIVITYWQEAKGEWVEKRIGSGITDGGGC